MSYNDDLFNKLKQRNMDIEPHKEIFTWYNKLIDENTKLKEQLEKCNKFIKNNQYELRNSNINELLKENIFLIKFKFSTNLINDKCNITNIDENYF